MTNGNGLNGGHASGWEHRQVDLRVDPSIDGDALIYALSRLPLRLLGVVRGGRLVDLRLSSHDPEFPVTPVERPHDIVDPESAGDVSLSRSWSVGRDEMMIHVEVWVDRQGNGFADLFAKA